MLKASLLNCHEENVNEEATRSQKCLSTLMSCVPFSKCGFE